MSKSLALHVRAVIKGILFIGFSIQIILGIVWMCCNFAHIQAFPDPDTVVYGWLFRLVGEWAPAMYLLQLAAAFTVGYFFLQSILPVGKWFALWRALALLTFPFAMQCHLALQPHSFVGTLFLAILLFVIRAIRGKKGGSLSLVCLALLICISGVADKASREYFASRGVAGMMAHRIGWSTLVNDRGAWPEDLKEMTSDVFYDATLTPDNMELLLDAIEAAVGEDAAKDYYKVIAETGWDNRQSVKIRQIGWDVLGYTVSPIVVSLQLAGDAYDSYTGRNFENMRKQCPQLADMYADYGIWWFSVSLVLAILNSVFGLVEWYREKKEKTERGRRVLVQYVLPVCACVFLSGIWVFILSMRGAGIMDYKWSIGVNELWLIWAVLSMGKLRAKDDCLDSKKSE